jgi:hypothetical protein
MFTDSPASTKANLDIRFSPAELKELDSIAKKLRVTGNDFRKLISEVANEINAYKAALHGLPNVDVVAKISDSLVSKLIIRQTLHSKQHKGPKGHEATRAEIQSYYDDATIISLVNNIRAEIDNTTSFRTKAKRIPNQAKPVRILNPDTPEGQISLITQFGPRLSIQMLATAKLTGASVPQIILDGVDAEGIENQCSALRNEYLTSHPTTDQISQDAESTAFAMAIVAQMLPIAETEKYAALEAKTGQRPEIKIAALSDDFCRKEFEADDY